MVFDEAHSDLFHPLHVREKRADEQLISGQEKKRGVKKCWIGQLVSSQGYAAREGGILGFVNRGGCRRYGLRDGGGGRGQS